jgi:tRNA (guanine37-N1)-methyltransferase
MHATVVTLFPELFAPWLAASVLGRAVDAGLVRVDMVDLRPFGEGRHRVVDDRPFGGGPGMVLMAEPVVRAVEAARAGHGAGVRTLLLTPQGRRFDQRMAESLAAAPDGFVLLAGRYEGIDERAIDLLQPEEVSVGDYVLSGGEAAALVVLDATARLVPGVLGHADSAAEDSFSGPERFLDHPHFTRPAVWRGADVPAILLSGDHAAVAAWRRAQRVARTRARRPDLLSGTDPGEGEVDPCSPAS